MTAVLIGATVGVYAFVLKHVLTQTIKPHSVGE